MYSLQAPKIFGHRARKCSWTISSKCCEKMIHYARTTNTKARLRTMNRTHIPWVACGVGISWTDRWGGRHFHCSSPSSSPPQFYPNVYHIQLHWSMASHWVQEPGETRGPEEQWSFEGSTTQSHLPSKCLGDLNRFFPTRTGSGLDEALLNDSAHSAQHINMSKNYGINHVKVRDYAVFKDHLQEAHLGIEEEGKYQRRRCHHDKEFLGHQWWLLGIDPSFLHRHEQRSLLLRFTK